MNLPVQTIKQMRSSEFLQWDVQFPLLLFELYPGTNNTT